MGNASSSANDHHPEHDFIPEPADESSRNLTDSEEGSNDDDSRRFTDTEGFQQCSDAEESLLHLTDNEQNSLSKLKRDVEKRGDLPPYSRAARARTPTNSATSSPKSPGAAWKRRAKSPTSAASTEKVHIGGSHPRTREKPMIDDPSDGSSTDDGSDDDEEASFVSSTTAGTGPVYNLYGDHDGGGQHASLLRKALRNNKANAHPSSSFSVSQSSTSGEEEIVIIDAEEAYARALKLQEADDDDNTILDVLEEKQDDDSLEDGKENSEDKYHVAEETTPDGDKATGAIFFGSLANPRGRWDRRIVQWRRLIE